MRTIPENWTRKTYSYHLLRREGKFAIYSQTHQRRTEPCAFELVRVRTREARKTPHFEVAAGEYLPSDGEWGRHGWTFSTLREAVDRLTTISRTPHTKPPSST